VQAGVVVFEGDEKYDADTPCWVNSGSEPSGIGHLGGFFYELASPRKRGRTRRQGAPLRNGNRRPRTSVARDNPELVGQRGKSGLGS